MNVNQNYLSARVFLGRMPSIALQKAISESSPAMKRELVRSRKETFAEFTVGVSFLNSQSIYADDQK